MASSGKITAHNLHLLQDDPEDAPGDDGQSSSIMPDDDLNLRTADSPSSVDSRRIDESPVDDPSPANLTEEARYQEKLKERVKKSFADLGIEPEGVLLKDSLEDTPRDIEIKDDLPYEEAPQGEYDARQKKSKSSDVNEDGFEPNEEVDEDHSNFGDAPEQSNDEVPAVTDDIGDDGDKVPAVNDDIDDDGDNFLADSLEADCAPHHEPSDSVQGSKNVPLNAKDNIPENYDDPQDSGSRDDYDQNNEDNDFVRDSLETDRADSELQELNESNPKSFGNTSEDQFDGDASDSFPTPVNQNIPQDDALQEQEEFPQLSKPFRLDDENNFENGDLAHGGEDPTENNHGEDEIDDDVGSTDNLTALSEQVYDDSNERTFSVDNKVDDGYENEGSSNSGPENNPRSGSSAKKVSPSEHKYDDQEQSNPLAEGSAPLGSDGDQFENIYPGDNVLSTDKGPISSDSRLSESRGESQSPAIALSANTNNNAKGPYDRPPSGGSVQSFRSNLNNMQRNSSGAPSPGNSTSAEDRPIARNQSSPGSQNPVRSRESSRERRVSARARHTPLDRARNTSGDRARQTPTDRVSSVASRPPSGNRIGSSRSRLAAPKEESSVNSRNSNIRERQNSRRGSNDINIPKYSRKGMTNSDEDDGSSREDLRNIESREPSGMIRSGNSDRVSPGLGRTQKVETVKDPHPAPSTLKPPAPPKLGLVSPNDLTLHGQADSTGSKPSPREFMTPGQRMEVEEDKQFWSEMHQAGVFPQPVNPNAPPKPKTQTQDQVTKLQSGEKVRVQYISDDSGDEDLHFVDEKGSPIDQLGRPLFSAKTPETPDMRIMYRIKPTPPRQKSNKKSPSGRHRAREVSAADSSRYGSGYSTRSRSGVGSGREGSRIPVKKLVDRQVSPIDDEISPEESQQQGLHEGTLPPEHVQQAQPRERPVKSACFQTGIDDLPPPEEQPEFIKESDFKSPVQETGIQTIEHETPVQATEEPITGNNDNTLPYNSQTLSPRRTREEAHFGQVRVAPYQQQPQQSPGFQQQLPSGYNQQGQMPFAAGAYAQPIPGNYHGNPQAHWQPLGGQAGYPNQSQQFAAPLQPQFMNPLMSPTGNQQIPQQMMQNYPSPQYHAQRQEPIQQLPYQQQGPHPRQPHPGSQYPYQPGSYDPMGSPGRPYPDPEPFSNETQETPDQPERRQPNGYRKPPKPKQNFIDLNKTSAKLRRDPPNKKYTEALSQKKGFKSPMNPRKPLPNISRENSLDDGQPLSTGWTPHGSATSRSNDQWAQAVFQEQQMIMLARGMSDPNIYPPGPPPPMRHGSVPGHFAGGSPYQGGYPTPDTNFNQINGQPYSWSADRAKAYARMNALQNANQPPMGGPYDSMDPRGSFDMNQTSPRQRMAYTHPMPSRTSPFQVLPDIQGSGRKSSEENELRTSDPDGYLVKLQKQKQGPQYKPYTLKDFQNLKKDFKLGGLGPDKETMGVRNEKVARQREYARQVMEQNKKTIRPNPKARTPGNDSPQTEASKRELMLAYAESVPLPRIRDNKSPADVSPRDTRSVALEYAKQIPKPRIPTPPEVLHERLYGSGPNSRNSGAGSRTSSMRELDLGTPRGHEENTAIEMARLQELTERHKQEKDELERLRSGVST